MSFSLKVNKIKKKSFVKKFQKITKHGFRILLNNNLKTCYNFFVITYFNQLLHMRFELYLDVILKNKALQIIFSSYLHIFYFALLLCNWTKIKAT